jgi:NAD(P)-dependent dehydrogenase (short-subunit alcohol dehydrogenase family)
MGSISAYLANSELTPYSVSKAGLLGLTRMMTFELAPAGIRVNAVAPGTIATDFVGRMLTAEAQAERERRIPMARFGTPDEVASTVAFLVSEDARYVTGTTILIDGGLVSAGIRSGQT